MILNALLTLIRAFTFCCVLACRPLRPKLKFDRLGIFEGRFGLMPDTEAGRFIGMITCGFVIMIAPMIWYYLKYGCVVKGLTLWFLRPDRKPPDPKSHKQSMRRRRLKKFISLMETLPIIILASDGKIPKFGLRKILGTW